MSPAVAALALLAAGQAAPATTVEAGYGHEVLSRGLADWRAAWIEAARTSPEGRALAVAARGVERFGLGDLQLSVAGRAPAGRWALGAEASVGLARELLPAAAAGVGAERALGHGLVASAGAKASWYARAGGGSAVGLASLGLERYWGAFRAASTGYVAAVDGAVAGSARLALDRFFRDRHRLGVSVAVGRELESLGGGVVLVTPVLGAALAGQATLRGGAAITVELAVQRQGDRYVRAGATLGLRRRL